MTSQKTMIVILVALCLSGPVCASSGFLRQGMSPNMKLDQRSLASVESELEEALAEVMGAGHGVGRAQLEATAAKIKPTFDALPKNVYGHIGRDALKYVVHRYFASEHGWNIKGFQPHGETTNSSDACVADVLKQKLPSYIESVLESKLAHHGFAVTDIVTMVATLERLIFDEGVNMLESAYHLNNQETRGALSEDGLQRVIRSFMMLYAMRSDPTNITAHEEEKEALEEVFPDGWSLGDFAATEAKAHIETEKLKNPFASSSSYSFDVASQAVSRISEGFGKWQNGECKELKDTLVSMDRKGNGRVLLSDFYARRTTPTGAWVFQETPDYLENLGVLDKAAGERESSLLIPNYVLSMSNCVEASDYYSICCLSECEGLMGAIEAEVRAPVVPASEIVTVVQRLLASAVTPRNLTAPLITLLDKVAEQHRGKVPIHGRLFSQWLHYVFPQECPLPHKSGEHNPLTASQWMELGKDAVLSDEELEDITEEERDTFFEEDLDADEAKPMDGVHDLLPEWSMEEELYVGHHHEGPRRAGSSSKAETTMWGSVQYGFGVLAKLGCLAGVVLALKPLVMQNYSPQQKAFLKYTPGDVFV